MKIIKEPKASSQVTHTKIRANESAKDGVSPEDVNELVLYITNDSHLYHRYVEPFIANLRQKVKRGVYDPDLAVKLWKHLADEGAKQYDKELNGGIGRVDWVSVPTRLEVAKELRDHYQERVDAVEASDEVAVAEEDEAEVEIKEDVEDVDADECKGPVHIQVKEDSSDNNRSRAESLKLTADYLMGQLRGLYDKIGKDDAEGAKLFFKNAGTTLKDLIRQFDELKANF